ncbi:prepilin-type N-terminal cleavage/methylation domain-containing protein [Candidatus Saccharibacteria bacterium]|nr:prepilin-type N-terminal cleavage/methylation domain-containing protein [Candidatus Saccharibacteria bacterium]
MKRTKLGSQGFTIVELLIVIVIIGILATIGFVSFSSAQNKAKKSKAQSTVSQVKSKLGEYFSENNSYPEDKAGVVSYLAGNGGATTSTEFSAAAYGYTAEPTGCTTAADDCTSFTLTAAKTYWNGDTADTDISVTP